MATIPEALAYALQHHQAGHLLEAEHMYRQILAVEPNHADALHLLGVLAQQAGKHEIAVEYISRAIGQNSMEAAFHNNLGEAYRALASMSSAVACYRRALELKPDYAEAHNNLGIALQAQGQLDAAVACCRRALELKPDYAEAHNNLGAALQAQGQLEKASACYRRALQLKPDFAEPRNNLGRISPQYHYDLGYTFADHGRLDEAMACFRRALNLKPDYAAAHNSLGMAWNRLGKVNEAIACCNRALELEPNFADAHNNLGIIFKEQGKLDDAATCFQRAVELLPSFAEAHSNLGNALREQGKLDDALACFRRALALKPDSAKVHSNLLLTLNYGSADDAKALYEAHRLWHRQHAESLPKTIMPHANERSVDRRLRVGYVSPDFRQHSVAFFLEPILAQHDPHQVEVFCYAEVSTPDVVTVRLRSLAHHWRATFGRSDDELAALIRADGIDVLVDLAGHMGDNRLLVFARKPAPVQVTYLGYPNTTGLQTIDYRLTDEVADPPGTTEAYYSEELLRLPGSFLCYRPPVNSPLLGDAPVLARGQITFGSFNALAKVSSETVALWSDVLAAVPGSRLLLKSQALSDEGVCRRVRERFTERGVDVRRLELCGFKPSLAEHLRVYQEVDIALDTFPYNGTTTTCEALWMGVPVVTLAGNTHVSRVGASLLKCVGLGDLVASTPADYVGIARRLATEREELIHWRTGLRERVSASPLCDELSFTRRLEAAYRGMWQRWCAK